VPQELAFHNDLSVAESCRFYARLKDVTLTRIPTVLEQVGLSGQTRKAVGALSGGMKQRLALALALLADPPVLLLDEPTSNLDAATREEFLDLLVQLHQAGKTMLFTSHHLEEVEQLADQVLILRDGKLLAAGAPAELMPLLDPKRRDKRIKPQMFDLPFGTNSLGTEPVNTGVITTNDDTVTLPYNGHPEGSRILP
jgi:ABC-type multidrug transport system ATPase subunit